MKTFTHPAISTAEDGQVAMAFGKHIIRIWAEDTGGSLGMLEAIVPPGEGPPLHVHDREDEFFRVISGRFGFWCSNEYIELGQGGCIALPRGVAHRFQNVGSEQGHLMVMVTPGGFEAFFSAVELGRPETPADVEAIAAEFGLHFIVDDTAIAA